MADRFQSTPPRGRRPKKLLEFMGQWVFQSTPPRGRRRLEIWLFWKSGTISIHSAARAETTTTYYSVQECTDFNPLRREGGDIPNCTITRMLYAFQSTPPRGRRLHMYPLYMWPGYFNPLRREGGDAKGPGEVQAGEPISIHSAARAETGQQQTANEPMTLFQSTPPRGRRLVTPNNHKTECEKISIHSAARAETNDDTVKWLIPFISIHSAARAETPSIFPQTSPLLVFQSTPPRGRRQHDKQDRQGCQGISIHSAARAET